MAREILIRLAVRNYERARDVAAQIAERAQRTLATAKNLSDELRTGLDRAQKAAALRERGAALGRTLFGGGEPSQTLPSLMTLAGAAVPGLGPFMALLAPLTQQLLAYLEQRLAQALARRAGAPVTRP